MLSFYEIKMASIEPIHNFIVFGSIQTQTRISDLLTQVKMTAFDVQISSNVFPGKKLLNDNMIESFRKQNVSFDHIFITGITEVTKHDLDSWNKS